MTDVHVLLSHALISLTRAYEATDPAAPRLPFYSVLLRVLDGDGADVRDLAARACISKRAVTTLVREAVRAGFATEAAKVVRLTAEGVTARDLGARTLASAEAAWLTGDAATLRAALEATVARFELEHPHYFVPYGTADRSAVGGPYPRHGTDWRPVPRVDPDAVRGLPITALTAQGLTNFTMRYEAGPCWSLAWTMHALQKFDDGGVAFADAPREAALTGDGRSTLERHGLVKIDAKKVARLTPVGTVCRDAYEPNVERVEHEWRRDYGDGTVDALRTALRAVDKRLTPGLSDFPVIAWNPLREASG